MDGGIKMADPFDFGLPPGVEDEIKKKIISNILGEGTPSDQLPGSLTQIVPLMDVSKGQAVTQASMPPGPTSEKRQDQLPASPEAIVANARAASIAPQAPQVKPFRESGGLEEVLGTIERVFGAPGSLTGGFDRARAIDTQNQTFKALMKKGVDEDVARAIVGNPELLKTMAPTLFGTGK